MLNALALALSAPSHTVETTSQGSSGAGTRAATQAQWAVEGKFSAPLLWPVDTRVMVHATLLPDGRRNHVG